MSYGIKIKLILFSILFAGCACFAGAQQRPLIGLSDIYKNGGSSAPRSYVDAVLAVGGIPVIVPLMLEDDKIVELLESLDGIIFTGGEDFDPSYYHEEAIPNMNKINALRDVFDIKLLRLAVEHGKPVLGICRGVQLINVAYGGSLYQDLPAQYPDKSIRHRQTQPKEEASHAVMVEEGTVWKLPPADFEILLRKGKAFVENNFSKDELGSRMILLDNWNEWSEGHYIAPYREYGFGYLDAIRRVFSHAPEEHEDLIPEDIGMGPYNMPMDIFEKK
ncbi:MAG: gamma-glutamyl-gamma-aminobutyrate hydrolase family protein [Tannerella sp.]|jgi:GMP synthase-like glutamine amidotransferase|nr:gamma-glutamyl-gamma-aminobutyrate hydrolase family protein [Tannerella sp.]